MIEPFYEMFDILLTYDTDIFFEDGDLMQCTGIDYIEREVYKVLITNLGDWKLSPNIGVGLSKFIGKSNTKEVGKAIETLIERELSFVVAPATIKCRVIPIGYHSISCIIDIMVYEILDITIPFELDFTSGKIDVIKKDRVVVEKPMDNIKLNNIAQMIKPNKYWERMRKK